MGFSEDDSNLHTQSSLQDQCDKGDNIHALVMLRDIFHYLQEKGSQWNAGPKAEIGKYREQSNNSEDDGTS